ncbi:MAG TPA: hypothetical protein VGM88_14580 [Kofleriaceae bacterium]|jgi:hypothetical protein
MRVLLFCALVAACGPITYVGDSRDASRAIEEARAANAETYAPYWWWRAVTYLHEARLIAGYADYQGATRFARLATDAATHAESEAILVAKDPTKGPIDPTTGKPLTGAAPAKGTAPAKAGGAIAPAKEAP